MLEWFSTTRTVMGLLFLFNEIYFYIPVKLYTFIQTRQESHDLGAQRGEQIPNQYQVDALLFEISQDLNFS